MTASWRRAALAIVGALAFAASSEGRAELRIGFANPLSGPYAATGERNLAVVETAVEDLNRNGGVLGEPVELVVEDDACGLEKAMASAARLIEAEVSVVVGHLCSHSSLLAAGLYEAADVLMLTPSSTHPRLTEEGRANVFRLTGRSDRQGELAAALLADQFAHQRIAILHDGSTYGESLAEETQRHLHRFGVQEILYDTYVPGADDYSGVVDRLRRADIDVLYVGGYGPDAGLILRTAREQDEDLQLVGGNGLGMDEFWRVAAEAGEGAIFSRQREVADTPEAAAVLKAFRNRNLALRPGNARAYAAVQVWAEAVERAESEDLAAVAREMRHGRFRTTLGRIAFDRNGDLRGVVWEWHVWRDGDYVPLMQPTNIGLAN